MLDWLIIGGGLQGSHVAARLRASAPHADIAVMDPLPAALSAWRQRADACHMRFLRSPLSHHLGLRTADLNRYAGTHGYDDSHFLGRYRQPSRALFEAHADTVTASIRRLIGRVIALHPVNTGWLAHTRGGQCVQAHRLVLATGPAGVARPAWGTHLPHLFDAGFDRRPVSGHTIVVGGGISAILYALACARAGRPVTLLTRRPLRRAGFDGLPCYAGPRCLEPFVQLPIRQRHAVLARARNPGTVPGYLHDAFRARQNEGRIRHCQGDVIASTDDGLQLADGRRLRADQVVLATGLDNRHGPLLTHTARHWRLPMDTPDHPRLGLDLAWAPGLHVCGRPASLQLGPMAGNIHGARLAGRRLAAVATRHDNGRALTTTA